NGSPATRPGALSHIRSSLGPYARCKKCAEGGPVVAPRRETQGQRTGKRTFVDWPSSSLRRAQPGRAGRQWDYIPPRRSRTMRSVVAPALVAVLAGAASAQSTPDAVTVIRAGRLIDGLSDTPRTNQVIVIRGNVIERVGDAASVATPAGAKVLDLSRETVLPG